MGVNCQYREPTCTLGPRSTCISTFKLFMHLWGRKNKIHGMCYGIGQDKTSKSNTIRTRLNLAKLYNLIQTGCINPICLNARSDFQ